MGELLFKIGATWMICLWAAMGVWMIRQSIIEGDKFFPALIACTMPLGAGLVFAVWFI